MTRRHRTAGMIVVAIVAAALFMPGAAPALAAPAAPTSVTATQSSDSTAVIVSWLPPPNTSRNLVGVYFQHGGYVTSAWCSGSCTSAVIPGLQPGVGYTFVVWSQDASGTSPGAATPPLTVSAVPSASPASVMIDDAHPLGAVNTSLFGTNYAIWTTLQTVDPVSRQPWPSVVGAASRLGLHMVRMNPAVNLEVCGGTDCTYHWMSTTPGAPGFKANVHAFQLSPDEWMANVAAVASASAVPMLQTNLEAGTVSEAQDLVAYMNGSPSSVLPLTDGSTIGHWAALRVANGHTAPYGVHFWEMGNEEAALRVCSMAPNGAHCVNQPPPACTSMSGDTLYGCLITAYASAMKLVDPSIAVVATTNGSDLSALHTAGGPFIDAIDVHEYTDSPIDPYGTTFDTDGQSADYPVTYQTSADLQPVSIGLWLSAVTTAHVDVYVDHASTPTGSVFVNTPSDSPYVVNLTEAAAGSHSRTVTVVACDSGSVVPATNTCATVGRHTVVYLRHLVVSPGGTTPAQLAAANGCFAGVSQLVDTRVPASSGATGNATNPGAPWRLGASTEFPVAFAAGSAGVFGAGPPGVYSKLQWRRMQFAAAGFTQTPLIIGEYAAWGECRQVPSDLSLSQSSAVWSALVTQTIYADQSTSQPIIGASEFAFSGANGSSCATWNLVTTQRSSSSTCQGSDTAYTGAVGLMMAQFAALTGTRVGASVAGGPVVFSPPVFTQPALDAPAVTAVASAGGGTATVVLVNTCPPGAATQCGDGSAPVQIRLASGATPHTASATTVSQTPFAVNNDGAPTTVAQSPLATSIAGGVVSVTLPPYSVSTVIVTS